MTQHQRQRRLDVDEFLDWADAQPEGRFELADGVVVAMGPERIAHVRAKGDAFVALRSAIAAAGLRARHGSTVLAYGSTTAPCTFPTSSCGADRRSPERAGS